MPHSWRSTLRVALLLALVVAGVVIIVATTRLLELSAIPGLILYGMPRRRTG